MKFSVRINCDRILSEKQIPHYEEATMNPIDSIICNIDFEQDGKQLGNVELNFSDNQHAFSYIPIPIASIKNGSGPTLLLTAGNHGDEYEGQVVLRRLIHQLSPTQINGRLIMMPALNYPAVLANARVSPLDRGNMNRSFPGLENGSPTSAIAHFVSTELLPLTDAGIDLHSGGSSSYYLPSTYLCTSDNAVISQQNLEMVTTFNAPYSFVVRGGKNANGFDPVAHNMGIPFISTELYGGANVDVSATDIGYMGVLNIMGQMGIITHDNKTPPRTRFLNAMNGSDTISAPFSGIFEPFHELGSKVRQGNVAGLLHSVEELEREPVELKLNQSGIISVQRNGARVKRGDHLFVVSSEMALEDVLSIM